MSKKFVIETFNKYDESQGYLIKSSAFKKEYVVIKSDGYRVNDAYCSRNLNDARVFNTKGTAVNVARNHISSKAIWKIREVKLVLVESDVT